ncbi:MAG: hypothetical protein QS748_13585 [Candidatus Endonucleobacter bathymodioli]|uniref:Uncharacterized protein n=1 Tax=Candidatus Endonucleibacter bathymodioli TaxID=539814 RepID=A0AA90NNN3_9GAMM|nr:hypothetical protein [Candidatus Endonucleobacter bathymodioli]
MTILNYENNDLISQKKSELVPVNVKLFAGESDVTNKELLLRLKLRRLGLLNLRSHTVKSNNGSITVMGARIPAWGTVQELLKNEFNTMIFLVKAETWMDIPDESKSIDLDESNSVDISNDASLMKFRHGDFDPMEINFTPVKRL